MGGKKGGKAAGGRLKAIGGRPSKSNPVKKKSLKQKGGGKGGAKKKGEQRAGKGAGKGAEKSDVKGKKRKAEPAEEPEDGKKGNKLLNKRQKRRREVTHLYSELINPGRERKADEVVSEIMGLLEKRPGPLAEYCSKEIGSRVVQAILKWGSHKQRREVLTMLKDQISKLAVDRYGHVVVLKLLRYTGHTSKERKPTEAEKKAQAQNVRELLEGFHGKALHAAFYHKYGCKVINGIYFSEVVHAKEKRRLLHDVAVPQAVALLRPELPGSKPLRHLLKAEDLTKEQRAQMAEHLREACEKAVDKELLGIDIVHQLYQAYCEVASEAQLKELSEKCMAGAPYLLSSKPGAEALIRLLGVISAKQRKAFCKELKGKFEALATNPVDYVVMMRMCSTIDDTVMLQKSMLQEWMSDLEPICFDKYGHRVLAWLLKPDDSHFFSPYERECLALPAPSALKAADSRRQELARALRPGLREVLLGAPLKALGDLYAKDLLVAYLASDWDAELVEAILAAGEAEASEHSDDLGLLGSGTATTAVLTLLKLESKEADAPLAMPLWRRVLEPHLVAAATSRCVFLLLGLLKHGGAVRKAVLASVRKQKKAIAAAVKKAEAAGNKVTGAKNLLAAIDEAAD